MTGEPPIDIDHNGIDDFSGVINPTIRSAFTITRLCLAVFGLIANTVAGVVLTNKKLWNPTSMLLLSLVAYDAVFLLATIPPSVVDIGVTDLETFALIVGIFYPLRFMAQTGSIYTTVTVTVERFLIVLCPLKARVFCTFGKTRKVILVIFVFSVLFNLPRCLFYLLATSFAPMNLTMTDNISLSLTNQSTLVAASSKFGNEGPANTTLQPFLSKDEERQYYIWLYTRVYELYVSGVFFYLLPYALIPILNMQLLLAIKKRRDETRRISVKNEHQLKYSKPTDLEDGLTMIVLGITVCFFICCLIPAIYNVTQIAEVPPTTDLSTYLLNTSDTMLCINAGTDFFFYCLLGRRFRNTFLHLFCPKKYLKRSRSLSTTHFKASHKNSETCYHSV